jgi:formate dehydrogenase (coenzyme F420) beta subunit
VIWDAEALAETRTTNKFVRILETRGDPLGALRAFLKGWWQVVGLDALLAPVQLPGCCGIFPQAISQPEQVDSVAPFAPLLTVNSAGLIDEFLDTYPQGRLAVILRPCEIRTYIEMRKRRMINSPGDQPLIEPRLAVIGIDCPGTLDNKFIRDETQDELIASLTCEALDWCAQGRWLNGHLRQACQICEWPIPTGADLSIGLFGQDSREQILLITSSEAAASQLMLEQLTNELTDEAALRRRNSTAMMVMDRRSAQLTYKNPNSGRDPYNILAAFARCSMCTDCLDACPLYDGELAGMLGVPGVGSSVAPLLVNLVGVSRWLASCSGCGLCQDACTQDVPLLNIVMAINHRIRSELNYFPGDPDQKLPWIREEPH